MSLGKFLAAGRSIMGGRGEISYRFLKGAALPKFISPKNPFSPPAKPEAPAPPVAVAADESGTIPSQDKVRRSRETPPRTSDSQKAKTQKIPVFRGAQVPKRNGFSRLNPALLWRRSKAATPPKTGRPTQAELSLDRVKVVHNDLSDADVEIVPIKSRTAPELQESAAPAVSGSDSWSRLSAKIFGVKAA